MKTRAKCKVFFSNERYLDTVFNALRPEVDKPATVRSVAFIKKYKTFLALEIEARDTVALRAALNAYLRWINSIVNVLELLQTV